jgi:hypothetical protein
LPRPENRHALPADPDEKSVHNERLKLTATFVNGVAVATVGVGVVTPIVAYLLDLQGLRQAGAGPTVIVGGALFVIGFVLHGVARRLLGDLR